VFELPVSDAVREGIAAMYIGYQAADTSVAEYGRVLGAMDGKFCSANVGNDAKAAVGSFGKTPARVGDGNMELRFTFGDNWWQEARGKAFACG
jgi:hypothetical protein